MTYELILKISLQTKFFHYPKSYYFYIENATNFHYLKNTSCGVKNYLSDCNCNSDVDVAEVLIVDIVKELDVEELKLEPESEQLMDKVQQDIVQLLHMGTRNKALGRMPYIVLSLSKRRSHLSRPPLKGFFTPSCLLEPP